MSGLERVKKLRAEARAAILRFSEDTRTRTLSSREGGDKPGGYNGATFLYIRGYDGDAGARPIPAGQAFWNSPDVELFDGAGVRIANNELRAGGPYTAEVTVTNDGDLDANACLVELFLDDPSIGFSTAAATALGTQIVAVGRQARVAVRFPFTATADMTGHRCMFARVSSFMTNDLPSDWVHFDAMQDRHLGQQNLNVVAQGTTFAFDVHLLPAFQGKPLALELVRNPAAFAGAPTTVAGRYLVVHERLAELPGFALARRLARPIVPARIPAVAPRGGARPAPRAEEVAPVAIRVEASTRWTLQARASEALQIDVPHLNLRANEALPLDLKLTDPASGQVIGGITLLVVA